jgi:NAD(P)-dependent dehydrogenase (short-subunit alcohol dehydrogenase family)
MDANIKTIDATQLAKDIEGMYKRIFNEDVDLQSKELKRLTQSTARLKGLISKKQKKNDLETEKPKVMFHPKQYCYICKIKLIDERNRNMHYTNMCDLCADINWTNRTQSRDLTGKVAIVTGGRVKIGYETAIRLLKNGCKVIVTSRFVDDCARRYQKEEDYEIFKDRLVIYQLDLLNNKNIELFVEYIYRTCEKLDFLINNAAQTIKRPKQFYQHLIDFALEDNQKLLECCVARNVLEFNDNIKTITNVQESGVNDVSVLNKEYFPENKLDVFEQQIDLRPVNSWVLDLDQVDTNELSEVCIINSIVPFMLCSRFKKLMMKKNDEYSWIINVSSMEGIFNVGFKSTAHPHTNMAKASLNMMTRTCGKDYIKSNIVMISVDTGWNNSQQPRSYDNETPLDCKDGASRILDPIFRELKACGIIYKDYDIYNW